MTSTAILGIWPPHEAFYIEAMLFCTSGALRAGEGVRAALDRGSRFTFESEEWQEAAREILDAVQTIAVQSAALSRYLWPSRTQTIHAERGARLRGSLGVAEDSPLRDRELRNHLEHFDERLDQFCQALQAGVILPTYVGPIHTDDGMPAYLFRAYYTDVSVFEVLGKRFDIPPLLDEVGRIHDILVECAMNGSRLPSHL